MRVRDGWERLVESLPAILLIGISATVAYLIASSVVGHEVPFLAATVTVSAIGFTVDTRLRQVLEVAGAMLIGILFAETVVLIAGKGWWQLAIVLVVTLITARFVSPSSAFAVAAAVQSLMVIILADPEGGPFTRALDGVIGGVVALVVTLLAPRDPARPARRNARRVLADLAGGLSDVGTALHSADQRLAHDALETLRGTQADVDALAASVDAGLAVARYSPWGRRRLPELAALGRQQHSLDLALRNARVVARRADSLIGDGRPRPELARLVGELAEGALLLGRAVDERALGSRAQQSLTLTALRMHPAEAVPGAPVTDVSFVLLLRPLVVDMLGAAGLTPEAARATLPPLG